MSFCEQFPEDLSHGSPSIYYTYDMPACVKVRISVGLARKQKCEEWAHRPAQLLEQNQIENMDGGESL